MTERMPDEPPPDNPPAPMPHPFLPALGLRSPALPLALLLILTPSLAFANTGTPLMWAGMVYLFGGNVVLGAVEGAILAKWFRLPFKRCIGWMILANILSAWVGQVLLTSVALNAMGYADLNSLHLILVASLVIAWLLTLLIEWPFTALCFSGGADWLRRSVLATVVIQTVSSALLGAFFMMASFFSLLTDHRIVASDDLPWPEGLLVYYVDLDRQTICVYDTDSGEIQVVHVMGERMSPHAAALYFSRGTNEEDSDVWSLVAGDYGRSSVEDELIEELGVRVDTSVYHRIRYSPSSERNDHRDRFPFGSRWHPYSPASRPLSIGPQPLDLQSLQQGFWAAEGLGYTLVTDSGDTVRHNLTMETPYVIWGVRHVMLLDDRMIMFQFGTSQVCLLDMRTQRVALKLKGYGPLAVPKDAVVVGSEEHAGIEVGRDGAAH